MEAETIVFKSGNSMAVRLLGSCRLERGTRVRERRDGNRIIIEPIADEWSDDFRSLAGSWTEDIERPPPEDLRDPFS